MKAVILAALGVVAVVATPSSSDDPTAKFRVHGLEEIEPAFASFQGKMYAGLLPFHLDDKQEGEFMFWLFEPDEIEVENALSIYLSGGPVSSSRRSSIASARHDIAVHRQSHCSVTSL